MFASDLNASITNVLNNPTSLISPWTANLDADGFDLLDLGEVEFRDESADPTADGRFRRSGDELTWRTQDARTNTTTRNWTIWADTTGAPAASIGVGMLFQGESADENPCDFGALDFVASDIGAGTEDTYLSIPLRVAGRALDEKYRFSSTAGEGFAALFAHAVTADRTYTLPDATVILLGSTGVSRVVLVRKTSNNTPVNNSTTLINDTDLLVALAANEWVVFTAFIRAISNATADFKFTFTVPAAATIIWNVAGGVFENTAGAFGADDAVTASGTTRSVNGRASSSGFTVSGSVANGANAGDLQFQFAQDTAAVVDTYTVNGSWMRVEVV